MKKPLHLFGQLVQPKYANDRGRLPPRGVIVDVMPNKTHGIKDNVGVLLIECHRLDVEGADPYFIIDAADNWKTT